MSWFKRNKSSQSVIPPVEDTPAPSYRSTAGSTYNGGSYNTDTSRQNSYGSNTGDNYGGGYERPVPAAARPGVGLSRGVGDAYSRGERNIDSDRNELFAGYDAAKSTGRNRFVDGPDPRRTPPPGEENDEDVEGIKQDIRQVKQSTVNSTRNALRIAREAEDTARGVMGRLGDQSEQLANTERHLDVSRGHNARAQDATDELKQLNRSIFVPVITWDKKAKRAAQEAERQRRYEEGRQERENTMMEIRETQDRVGRSMTYGRGDGEEEGIGGFGRRGNKSEAQQNARKEQRKRFQFEATGSDDEMEDELDDNLDEISDVTKRLKALGNAMGQELDRQNERITRIDDKTVKLDGGITTTTDRLKRIK